MTTLDDSKNPEPRLGRRVAEFSKLVSVSRGLIEKLASSGELRLTYLGTTPIVPRTEAIRLGLISD
jgi:hypothetical protein